MGKKILNIFRIFKYNKKQNKMTTEVKQAIEKLTLSTDIVKEVEAVTEKHYSLNQRFQVIRDGKEYFISIKKVDVNGQVIKSHVRLDIDTDLPKKEKPSTRKEKQIEMWQQKLDEAIQKKNQALINNYKWNIKKLRGY
jgi:hypothetical protein